MKSLTHAPLFKLTLFFLTGIFAAKSFGSQVIILGLAAGFGFLICYLFDKNFRSQWYELFMAFLILLSMTGLGAGTYIVSTFQPDGPTIEDVNCEQVSIVGKIVSKVKTNDYGRKAWMEVIAYRKDSSWVSAAGKLQLYINPKIDSAFDKHDTLYIHADIRDISSKYSGYLTYLKNNGIHHAAYVKRLMVGNPDKSLQYFSEKIQATLSNQMLTIIPQSNVHGIALAMFLGNKEELLTETREAFTTSGLSHILAISGLHVGIVFMFLNLIFAPLQYLKGGSTLKHVLILIFLIGYMFITGASPAVVRAVLMFATIQIFRLFYLRFQMLNLLAISALLQLIHDPAIAFQVGFQLSYSAVVGLVVLFPIFEQAFPTKNIVLKKLYGWIGVTLVATISTMPLVLYYFGQFPTYFLFSNLLASLIAYLVILVGFLTLLLSYVPVIGPLMGNACGTLLNFLNEIALQVSSLPHATITEFSWTEAGMEMVLWQIGAALLLLILPRLSFKGWINGAFPFRQPQLSS